MFHLLKKSILFVSLFWTINGYAQAGKSPICVDLESLSAEEYAKFIEQQPSETNRKLFEYYCQWKNYDPVWQDVKRWFGSTTNACVAFMSTALRKIGISLPAPRSNDPVSTITKDFSTYLERRLSWKRVEKMEDLRPGDLIFTEDDPNWPTYPEHVSMFQNWSNFELKLAWSVDNQGHTHIRDFTNPQSRYTPYKYGLRAPN